MVNPNDVKSQDDLNTCNDGERSVDVLIHTIDKCEKLEAENKELKKRLYNIWLECQKPWQQDDERALINKLAYILHLSSVFKEKELNNESK